MPDTEKHYRISIRRPVAMIMLFLTIVVFGWKSYQGLSLNLMPDIAYPTLTVRTEYEGAAPEDIEKLVTRPLEESLSTVSGTKQISSISSAGVSEIILEFSWAADMTVVQQDVRDRLDLFEPPREVTKQPIILKYDPSLDPVMRVAITPEREDPTGASLMEIREAAEEYLKGDLEAEIGIAQALLKGGREEEIQVQVDPNRLKSLGMSVQLVSQALASQNINLSGGRLKEGRTEYFVRTKNEFTDIAQIPLIVIGRAGGRSVKLEDVATVRVGEKDRESVVRFNGIEAVLLEIYKEGDANTVRICNRLKDFFNFERQKGFVDIFMEELAKRQQEQSGQRTIDYLARAIESRLPSGTQLAMVSDQSRFIVGSINEVRQTAVYGGLLALLILFCFLRELRTTAIIGIAIPISVVATFIPMFMRDISLNIMSLGGLALGVGMLVDNSIVVLESIFRCKEEGDGVADAAERGTHEVGSAVIASTLTTIAVFFPIVFVEGIAGQIFADLAMTVTFALLASLLVALYLIPMLASREGAVLGGGTDAIWVMRAWREGREAGGATAALAGIPRRGIAYCGAWFRDSFAHTVSPTFCYIGGKLPDQKRGFTSLVGRIFAVLGIPFLIVLYVLQVILRVASMLITTTLFVVLSLLAALIWIVFKLVSILLWTPLQLFDIALNGVRAGYTTLLRGALQFSPIILIGLGVIAYNAYFTMQELGQELIPPLKQGEFGIRMEAPPGTRLLETERRARRIEEVLVADARIDSVMLEVGSENDRAGENRGENAAKFTVILKNPKESAAFQDEIIESLRTSIARVASEEITFTLPTLFSFKTALELQIRGDDMDELRRIGNEVLNSIRDVEGLKDPELSLKRGFPEIIISFNRLELAAKGITPIEVAQRLNREVGGEVATKFNRAGEKVDLRVRTDRVHLQSIQDLAKISVVEGQSPIPLESVARISREIGPSEIRRVDQRQVVLITANVEGRDLGAVSAEVLERARTVRMPIGYDYLMGGQSRELGESFQSMAFALMLAIFLVYVVMASQFESIWHPVLIMFSVPLAFIGVAYVLKAADINLSVVVFIGGIVLAGIVVNNSIVLVDYINQLRRRGIKKYEAIIQAGQVRLRPILMTTLTTVLGLVPMVIWGGDGAEMRQPMAITVMAGLSFSTLLTLFVIPMVYYLFGGRDKT